jgi:hypothetical protein
VSILLPGGRSEGSGEARFIYARSGKPIPCENVEIDPLKLTQIRGQELMSWRRNLIIRSISNYPYNCVGMIFASRRAWIEIDYIYEILREEGYRQIPQSEIMAGDMVLYKNRNAPTHVALIVDIDRSIGDSIRVISKWGKDPEFIHFQENVPDILGKPVEYWTERMS